MAISLDVFTVKQATIGVSASGDNTIVAAVAGKQIWVLKCVLIANAAVNGKFQSGASGTDLTGLFYLAANTGFAMNQDGGNIASPWFKTASGSLLNLNLSGAVAVGGVLSYIEV